MTRNNKAIRYQAYYRRTSITFVGIDVVAFTKKGNMVIHIKQ